MADTPISSQVYASRDSIRNQIIEYTKQYMELDNVDLTQSSFLSYVIDVISALTSNLMFYQDNVYREFFLTKAQLPESIHNLSSFLGYRPSEATYATANVLMTVPLPFTDPNTTFTIPDEFEFSTSDGITFITYYETTVAITNNTGVSISADQDGRVYNVPVGIDTTSEDQTFTFVLPVRQYKPTEQEFQIDEDLQPFQFTTVDVPIEGKVANITVYVRDPDEGGGATGRLYTEFTSLYLMGSDDYGYVVRTSSEGKRLYFGNGLIGQQPLPGSTVIVSIDETEGADGNVIAGSIVTGDRIYSQQSGITTIVDYTVTNPSSATGGADEESLEDIRSNSITNLTALNRLVTEGDYEGIASIVDDAPVAQNSIPVLKRSDLKVNEIQLFTVLLFGDEIVPTRNVKYTLPSVITYIPRGTIISVNGINYVTLFEMTLDSMNEAAYYHYIMYELQLTPLLIQSWRHDLQDPYHFHANELTVSVSDSTNEATFELTYYSNELDFADIECEMQILSNSATYTMTNVPGAQAGTFRYTFPNYMTIPEGEQTYYFTFSNPNLVHEQLISQYSVAFTFRDDLSDYMMSNTSDDGTTTVIYDIPVIKKSYYDGVTKQDFELQVLQALLSSMDLKSYRMLTDFTNVKFCNATGVMTNMLRNDVTRPDVKDIGLTSIPTSPSISDRYIISGNEGGEWEGKRDQIALCTDSTSITWTYIEPTANDIVNIDSKPYKYIYTQYGWAPPIYDIPLQIELEVFRDPTADTSDAGLSADIKTALVSAFSDRFGPNIAIYRTEMIDVIQGVTGVSHCRLIKPESSIFFNFNISDFSQQELLEYGPEWVYFTEDDIVVRILTQE